MTVAVVLLAPVVKVTKPLAYPAVPIAVLTAVPPQFLAPILTDWPVAETLAYPPNR